MNRIESLYKEWLSLQPIKKQDQDRLDQKFMLEFNYNSNHIEGNTLTYGQTEMLLLFGKVVDDAAMKDLEEMKASNVGLQMIKEEASKNQPLTEYFIRTLHKTLLRENYTIHKQLEDGTSTSFVVHAGQYKTRPNTVKTITGEIFEYASPAETPALMNDLIQWYNQAETEGTMTPIELASLFHYRYIRIHPFEDGNGRISRLMVNYILYRHNYPMLVVKTNDKQNYLTALNRCDVIVGTIPSEGANATLSQITPFVEYMTKCLERALTICIKGAKGESITEADDWKKTLRVKYGGKLNKPALTVELRNKILQEDFGSLLEQINQELSEFYSIFNSVIWEPSVGSYFTSEEEPNYDYFSTIYFEKEFHNRTSKFEIHIQLTMHQFIYQLEVIPFINNASQKCLVYKEFTYSEIITEKDRSYIVNAIGNYLTQFLETES